MILLYSETLHQLYLFSGGWTVFFYSLLFLFAMFHLRQFKGEYRYILYFIIACFIFEMAYMLTNLVMGLENNLFIGHFYIAVPTVILALFYHAIFDDNRLKKATLVMAALLVVATLVFAFIDKGYLEPPKLILIYYSLFLLLSLLVHRKLTMDPSIGNLKREPLFWINTAFIVSNAFVLLFYAVNPIVLKTSTNLAFIIGFIKNMIDPVYLILIAIGIKKIKA